MLERCPRCSGVVHYMNHIKTKSELLAWVASNTIDTGIRDALNHGTTILWGLFNGGWVIETRQHSDHIIVGVRVSGIRQKLSCGRLKKVPWYDYIGGKSLLSQGDFPAVALQNRAEYPKTSR